MKRKEKRWKENRWKEKKRDEKKNDEKRRDVKRLYEIIWEEMRTNEMDSDEIWWLKILRFIEIKMFLSLISNQIIKSHSRFSTNSECEWCITNESNFEGESHMKLF
jgi:hypothetical protein